MGVKTVRAVRDNGMTKGATGPHIMECDDGKTYIVKFAGIDKSAINEFVGQTLARAVGLPVPDSAFVEVGEDVVSSAKDLTGRKVYAGIHHGSEMVPRAMELGQFLRQHPGGLVGNIASLPQTICHDNWVLVRDRERDDNHLFAPADGVFRYVMVDFSHGFTGQGWTADTIEQGTYDRVPVPVHTVLAGLVRGVESFEPVLSRIESLPDSVIDEALSAVPSAWALNPEETGCLAGFLQLRRSMLRGILLSGKGAFPNWP